MKIIHISDTHGLHRQLNDLPEADVIVHSGDISNNGEANEVLEFLNWYMELPYKHNSNAAMQDTCRFHSFVIN